MSLAKPILLGGVVGCAVSVAVYASAASPALTSPVSGAPHPVPTPTQTVFDDCVEPAVLVDGTCVTTVPGPTVTVVPQAEPVPRPRVTDPTHPPTSTPSPSTPPTEHSEDHDDDDDGDDDESDDHGDDGEDHAEDHGDEPGEDSAALTRLGECTP